MINQRKKWMLSSLQMDLCHLFEIFNLFLSRRQEKP